MIDCGIHTDRPNPIDVILDLKRPGQFLDHMRDFAPYNLKQYSLTLLSVSHPDDDHIRNVEDICDRMPPALLHRRRLEEFPTQSLSSGERLQQYRDRLCNVYRGANAELKNRPTWAFQRRMFQIPMEVVTRHQDFAFGKVTNNSSVVTLLEYGGWNVLFGGDLETVGWEWLVKNDQEFRDAVSDGIDVLIAPHHGHKSAFPDALFRLAGPPRLSILSKGSEFSDKSDVDPRYSRLTSGMNVKVLRTSSFDTKKAITSRRNGRTYLDFTDPHSASIFTEC